MANRGEIVRYLNDLLRIGEFKDYTCNGLEVEGSEEVQRIGFAVDACAETIEALSDCQMIVVHHGLWWPSVDRVVGLDKKRLGTLLTNDISLYVSHLPLDRHPQLGNNAQILRALGYEIAGEFGDCSWYAELPEPVGTEELIAKFAAVLGDEVKSWRFGTENVSRLAICTGSGGQKFLALAQEKAMDLYLTGEGNHTMYHMAKELGLNVAFGGHYRTETFGVKALMPYLEEAFGVETRFFDCPTGM